MHAGAHLIESRNTLNLVTWYTDWARVPNPHSRVKNDEDSMVCCSTLQSIAVCCSVLQCVTVCCTVCCNVFQNDVVCCSVSQDLIVFCSALQRVAVCGSMFALCCSEQTIPPHTFLSAYLCSDSVFVYTVYTISHKLCVWVYALWIQKQADKYRQDYIRGYVCRGYIDYIYW